MKKTHVYHLTINPIFIQIAVNLYQNERSVSS